MIEVLVEVGNGATRFGAVVRDESIRRAVESARARYPGAEVQVLHPIEPEAFFVYESAAPAGLVEVEMPESVAG
jgi:hypothetical protein